MHLAPVREGVPRRILERQNQLAHARAALQQLGKQAIKFVHGRAVPLGRNLIRVAIRNGGIKARQPTNLCFGRLRQSPSAPRMRFLWRSTVLIADSACFYSRPEHVPGFALTAMAGLGMSQYLSSRNNRRKMNGG